ncbi:MAG TPA: GNAT family N-acetyltransferase [Burkholderiaceae bacterium]|nr:GNAT family N-acetyltransferase [Burkholderiaceae bacterium]
MNAISSQYTTTALVRDATPADIAAITEIYTPYVLQGLATFEEKPPSEADMRARREAVLALGLPYLVAELDGQVAGYAYATHYRPRSAYRYTIEDSIYVRHGLHGHGIGTSLLRVLIERCEKGPWRQMLAVIGDSANVGSIALHQRFGFVSGGTQRAVGFKLGRWIDTVQMQRPLGAGDTTPPDAMP